MNDFQVGDLVRIEVGRYRGRTARVAYVYDDGEVTTSATPLIFNPNGLTLIERAKP